MSLGRRAGAKVGFGLVAAACRGVWGKGGVAPVHAALASRPAGGKGPDPGLEPLASSAARGKSGC